MLPWDIQKYLECFISNKNSEVVLVFCLFSGTVLKKLHLAEMFFLEISLLI